MLPVQMGSQTPLPIETLPDPNPQSQTLISQSQTLISQSPPKPSDQIPPPIPTPEPSIPIPTQNPSKIPIRPQKIRKLSHPNPNPNSTPKTRRRNSSNSPNPFPQIMRSLLADGEIELSLAHLRISDPLLSPLIENFPPPQFEAHLPPFHALTKSILYQQLAYKAGTTIYTRFVSLCDTGVSPATVLSLSSQQLKQIGVSSRKASYLYDLANKYNSGILSDEMVLKMDDRSLFTMLSMVKGIGSWSVHMFMIFSLYRPDVLPVSDLGVRKGVQMLYGLSELPRPSVMEQLCEKWRPYRSVGAWYMWRFVERKNNVPVVSDGNVEGSFVQPLQQVEAGHHHDGQRQQHQLQFVDSVNGIESSGHVFGTVD